ncbi:hypothetical protein [Paraburkholderia sp.]|jgi:hypothetical protein|uniref:hypothetical protein n=1 Tax=Paraburkholderia sp. TaxID=1926495 RepID=UPI002F3F0595
MKRTLIAAAVLAVASSSVFAHGMKDPYIFNATLVGEEVGMEGFVTLWGCVHVSSSAGAVVNNTQNVWANASISPNAQTYTSGKVTTTINNNSSSIHSNGSAYALVTKGGTQSAWGAQAFQASGGYAYGNQSSAVAGGGYEYSQQAAGIAGDFTHSSQNQGGHIAAGGKIQGGFIYGGIVTPNFGVGGLAAEGSLSAGYKESSYSNTANLAGAFEATEGSGQGKVWGFQANQGSGYAAVGEESSGYETSGSTSTQGVAAVWGVNATQTTTDVTTTGYVTEHINTQKAGTLTATTGTGVGNGASGNVGINIAEGVDNAQSNDASLAAIDAGNVFGNAQVFNTQSSGGKAKIDNFVVNASIGDGSLQGASGNIGVNVAAGIGNAQNNSLAASTTTASRNAGSVAMVATDQNSQSANLNFSGSFEGTANLGTNSLQYSSGNIGVNIAGGAGNLQHNGLAIASLTVNK